jgi:hypothetical protein
MNSTIFPPINFTITPGGCNFENKVGSFSELKNISSEDDILGQIERLGTLRDKGILTNEEFEQKKKELLARL